MKLLSALFLLATLLLATLLITGATLPAANLVESSSIGQSTNGLPIEVYRFGSGWHRVIFVGGIHGGYERNTVDLAWQIIDYFAANPTLVPNSITLEIVPVANPDGLAKVMGSADRTVVGKRAIVAHSYVGRFNGNNVDLNRNWDCNWRAEAIGPGGRVSGGSQAMSEAETIALAAYLSAPSVKGVVFWHSSANGVYAGGCADDFLPSIQLSRVYANASGYPFQPAFSAYPITGDATNWLSSQGIPAITIELRSQSIPEFDQNLHGVLAVLQYISYPSTRCTPIQASRFYAKSIFCKTWLQP